MKASQEKPEALHQKQTLAQAVDAKKNLEERFWIDSNLNKFDELLRLHHSKSVSVFSQIVIDYLGQLANAFSGILYILDNSLEDDSDQDAYTATASYTIQMESIKNKTTHCNDGIIGQAISSQNILKFDNIPARHVRVTFSSIEIESVTVRILPLVFNDQVYGVLEITFITPVLPQYDELLERMVKSLAGMVESMINNALNARLLSEFREQTEVLMAQEEELRQNIDEITATREALSEEKRKLLEKEQKLTKPPCTESTGVLRSD